MRSRISFGSRPGLIRLVFPNQPIINVITHDCGSIFTLAGVRVGYLHRLVNELIEVWDKVSDIESAWNLDPIKYTWFSVDYSCYQTGCWI